MLALQSKKILMNLFFDQQPRLALKKLFQLYVVTSLLISNYSYADALDVVNFVGGVTYLHDDNFFRASKNALGGSTPENLQISQVGFTVDKKYSLQEFKFNYFHVMNKYQNNSSLDFDANNYSASWLWALTPELKGTLLRSESENLIGFTDRADRVQNIRSVTTTSIDADWSPFGNWHALGGASKIESTTTKVFQIEPSTQNIAYNVGARYQFRSNSLIELTFNRTEGEFARKVPIFLTLDDVGYTENVTQLRSVWIESGHTTITARVGYLSRKFDTFSIRDFDGVVGGLNVNWNASAKVLVSVGLTRGLSSFLSQSTSYGVTDTFFITPTWQITPKIFITGTYQKGFRDLLGAGPVASSVKRADETNQLSLNLNWSPRESVKIGLGLVRDTRDSNVSGIDYESNSFTVNGQLTF